MCRVFLLVIIKWHLKRSDVIVYSMVKENPVILFVESFFSFGERDLWSNCHYRLGDK